DPHGEYDDCTEAIEACDDDADDDGIPDRRDNCPNAPNPDQQDIDGDTLGDACDVDDDGDNRLDEVDNCQFTYNRGARDIDGDGLTDFSIQGDVDGDGIGDACDPDADDDGIDCGLDERCATDEDGADNNRNNVIDEPGECMVDVEGCFAALDLVDNDLDGFVDERNELFLPFARYPG
ncbi:MAG: thrombospondin type 3 repeat-containing protein, partial [Myxococcales bacterium]|nr:thrombospondin type 3 repeat-containing protein [Myxococcales bacterium]